jgi:hypothetical protein
MASFIEVVSLPSAHGKDAICDLKNQISS